MIDVASRIGRRVGRRVNGEFTRFLVVGGIGFVVDGGGTGLLVLAGLPPLVARIPALVSAIVVTWLLNRSLTFRVDRPRSAGELMRYATVAASSALMNFLLYTVFVVVGAPPIVAVATATLALLLLNFVAYRRMVFR